MSSSDAPVVTLDGPAGAGKGAVGQRLALALGWHFLDSGALYRACAYAVESERIDAEKVAVRLREIQFDSIPDLELGDARVILDNEDITSKVRTSAYGELASKLAANPKVREGLLRVQHRMRRTPGLIADGRDMGTVVFPDATVKVYLSADLEIRAKRKYEQLKQMDNCVKLSSLYTQLNNRDHRDSTRTHAPLAVPAGAFTLDTSHMSLEQVVDSIENLVRARVS